MEIGGTPAGMLAEHETSRLTELKRSHLFIARGRLEALVWAGRNIPASFPVNLARQILPKICEILHEACYAKGWHVSDSTRPRKPKPKVLHCL